ncbi:MAG TPA: acetyl-coenzyme A synthetase N-terminal domain-containing protein, partial [Pseudonocardia sp.]|uniref:acetyl-coenzyme A synthetase N-terminal domain-containing protein n=1 Tax=Pseudonocardia sp. TaxID=60912 RepID=UPI002CA8728C
MTADSAAEPALDVPAADSPEQIWTPDPERAQNSGMAQFARWVGERHAVQFADYAELHAWSVRDLPGFWSSLAEFAGMRFHSEPTAVLGSRAMPGAEWFPGATLNYAEHALGPG